MHILYFSTTVFFVLGQIWVTAREISTYDLNINRNVDQDYQSDTENSYSPESINFQIKSDPDWPNKDIKLGQVSGVALDVNGNVYVFHRGPRIWDVNSFDNRNIFTAGALGPIAGPTVAVIHPSTGELLYTWGKHMFYLPHGITVDHNNNVWITDVAMHQVFKFPPIANSKINNTVPSLTLGTKLEPGSSLTTFCKPTAVAVLSSGEFFVSDGYCNSRIIKYNADGTMLMYWGRSSLAMGPTVPKYHFYIPHDLTLAEDKNLLFVSDRENGRVQCFLANNGTFVYQIQSNKIGSRIFSSSYTPVNDGLLFLVNGPDTSNSEIVHGSVVTVGENYKFVQTFQPNTVSQATFRQPHDIIVSPNGTSLYVAELLPFRVWKFNIDGLRPSVPVAAGRKTDRANSDQYGDGKTSGTMLMAIFITAIVLCFGAVLLTTALIYSRARTRGCSGHCKNATWLVGRSPVEGFKLGNFLGQQHQGFVKLNNFEESDEDEANVSPTFA